MSYNESGEPIDLGIGVPDYIYENGRRTYMSLLPQTSYDERKIELARQAKEAEDKKEFDRLFETIDGVITSRLNHLSDRPASLSIYRDEDKGELHIVVKTKTHSVDVRVQITTFLRQGE